jgi:protein phosphatase
MAAGITYRNQVLLTHESVPFWRNSLFILVGPSGSGKSTFAKKYFPATMTVSTDFCRSLICDSQSNQKVSDDAFDLFYFIIEKRLKNGYPAIADSTALKRKYREKLLALANRYSFSPVLLLFDLPPTFCEENDKNRRFCVGEEVQKNQFRLLESTREELSEENYDKVIVFLTKYHLDNFRYRWSAPLVECTFPVPFDIIGDVHGCYSKLKELLLLLGYQEREKGNYSHLEGRRLVFLGDIMDRGVDNLSVFHLVYQTWAAQEAYYIPGNHCNKLFRYLKGANVHATDGLEKTIAEIQSLSQEARSDFTERFLALYTTSPPYLVMDHGRLVASHAGILDKYIGRVDEKVVNCCLYGPQATSRPKPESKYDDWVRMHCEEFLIVYGHTPVAEALWQNHTINIDLGAVFGGPLCALRYPEREIVKVSGCSL